jgi:hypothetical protein
LAAANQLPQRSSRRRVLAASLIDTSAAAPAGAAKLLGAVTPFRMRYSSTTGAPSRASQSQGAVLLIRS